MQFRERQNESANLNATPGVPGPGDDGSELDALRAQGSAFLAAGNAIIDAALSGDSQAFLQANRQQGGQ
jgi:hypothetical protein